MFQIVFYELGNSLQSVFFIGLIIFFSFWSDLWKNSEYMTGN